MCNGNFKFFAEKRNKYAYTEREIKNFLFHPEGATCNLQMSQL